jgi:anaerobic magnesium-protoporphyrin IX monomethyl ester cyclase
MGSMKTKILLINPPQTFYPGSDLVSGNIPLGLMYLAAVLDKAGYKVEILDAFIANSAPRTVGDTVEIGMPHDEIKAEIQRVGPDIVGVANPFSTQVEHAKKVADIAKEVSPKILTAVGGPHVTVMPKEFLEEAKNVDICVIGEGEYTMLDIAKYHAGEMGIEKVEGIGYRQNGEVKLTEPRPFITNLDELPYPAYHLVNMEQYLNPVKIEYRSFKPRALAMITSRGCPHSCCFCSVHLHMGKGFRANSASYVADHIQHVVDNYEVKNIFFEDDNLTFDQKRMETICDQIVERKLKFRWETPNGVRADRLTEGLLKKMKKSGCRSVFFGIESGDQSVSDNIIHKDLDLEKVVEISKICKKIHLKSGGFYIIGFPGEKKENMQKTVDFGLMLKRDYDVGMHLLVATPSFGTKLYEECMKRGYIKENLTPRSLAEVRQNNGKPLIETEDFSAEDVKEIAAKAMKEYKHLSMINSVKYPGKTLGTLFHEPNIAIKFLKNLLS